jgi:hypothetical protein
LSGFCSPDYETGLHRLGFGKASCGENPVEWPDRPEKNERKDKAEKEAEPSMLSPDVKEGNPKTERPKIQTDSKRGKPEGEDQLCLGEGKDCSEILDDPLPSISDNPYEGDEDIGEPEIELDLKLDPLEESRTRGHDEHWEEKIRIRLQKPNGRELNGYWASWIKKRQNRNRSK